MARAELLAAVVALEAGAKMVVSDNQGVVQGINGIACRITRVKPGRSHADLWRRVAARVGGEVREWARWVPSHTDEKAVQEGRISWRDRVRNAEADALAGEGMEAHTDETGWEELVRRRKAAQDQLNVAVGILAEAKREGV